MQQAIAPEIRSRVAEVGAFDSSDGMNARPGRDGSAAAVVASGFESSQAISVRAVGVRGGGSVSGFGAGEAGPAPVPRRIEVKQAGFADAPPTQTAVAKPKEDQAITPVEVLFKPTPAYSDEARSLRIEGEVTLEVDFCATGQVRVIRVLRGLGHGLDEVAVRAAEQIRFKPAQSGGRAVDFRANVQIAFRLA